MSAPAFGTIGTLFGSTTSTPAIAVPASVASGDAIVVVMFTDVSTTTISAFPTGFTEVANSPQTVNSGGGGSYAIHVCSKRASAADTGTYSFTLSASVFSYAYAVRYTGAVAAGGLWDVTTSADGGATSQTTTPDTSLTTTGPDELLIHVGESNNGDAGTWSAPTSFTLRSGGGAGIVNISIADLAQAAAGGTGNVHSTSTASGQTGAWFGALIGTTVAGGSIPPLAPRYPQYRDYGEVQWTQGDRRNLALVATAANPLVSPLDSAWQAGGQYWHLYGDTAARDRRFVPQQRNYVSNPSLLTAAELENELLGGADTLKRYVLPATHVDRREVPQQRNYVSDPLLLTTAELENELLDNGETLKRYIVPATHVDRREVPQQPPRRTLYFDAGPDVPPLTLSWGADGRYSTLYSQPAWQPDRREVPQQRLYISDPSFYPTIPPTDPLTVAWGVGGVYWLTYNQAALYVDRREVPQQRPYISDPLLLTTALLENELLGGADDRWRRYGQWFTDRREAPQQRAYISDPLLLGAAPTDPLTLAAGVGGDIWRRYHSAAYYDRREVPQQRSYISDPTFLPPDADPLTLAGDTWRRWNTPVYYDRREVPQQSPRWTVYFDAGPGTPPLTLAWGAGGSLWHTHQWRREARSWWQPRPVFMPLGSPCTTLRPGTGTTSRPNTGITLDECHQ